MGKRYISETRKSWYERKKLDPDWHKHQRDLENARKRKVLDFLKEYKLNKGCMDCGYKLHHAALDFDHVTGEKSINVCNAKSIDQATKEIEKCEVVCSNCHRIRTYKRIYEYNR